MGGGSSTPPPPPPTPPPPPPPPLNDRVFILIGKSNAGKSTLGNLLLGRNQFKMRKYKQCVSMTQSVESTVVTLSPGEIMGMNCADYLRIKLIDQPGMDDANITAITHCENLVKCMSEVDVKTFPTFLLLIDLASDRFLDDKCSLLTKLSLLLSQASYSLFSHTVVVFTHADEVCDDIRNREKLMQIVTQKCQKPGWRGLTEILEEVNQRCIFVNATNTEADYRNNLLRDLFKISKSILQMRFHGNNDFTSAHLKHKLGIKQEGIVEEELYILDYQFHPDIDLYWMEEVKDLNMEEQIAKALQSMVALGEGISSMVILINLLAPFSEQMEQLIHELPTSYTSESDPHFNQDVQRWWNHVFIVFEVSNDSNGEAAVKGNLRLNQRMKILADKVNNRWTWIAQGTSQRVCRDRITDMCLQVRKEIGGKVFIKDTVIREIDEMISQEHDTPKDIQVASARFNPEFHETMAQGAIKFFESDNKFVAKFKGLTLKPRISVGTIRLLLRNTMLSQEELKRFREKYRDPEAKVSIEEVLNFLASK